MDGTCGDGIVSTGEACDDGAANSDTIPDACRLDCTKPACGDGVIDSDEECDDGAANGDDKTCSTTCTYTKLMCGDGVVDIGEECDDGADNSDTAPDACRTNCEAATCGDGVVDSGEACDDGADNSDTKPDACRTDCTAPACGDGVVDAASGEHCDLGSGNSDASGSTCSTTCKGLWKFVSMPDFLNYDIGDVSTLTGIVNSTNMYHEDAIKLVLDSIAQENPDFVLVAGDLVGGHWHSDADGVGVFGPVSTVAEKRAAVALAADTYYPQWKQRFAQRGIPVHAAVGDHDIGDNDWPTSQARSELVNDFKNAWAKHLTKLSDGSPRYTDRPVGTDFENTAYAFRHKNMLVVTADVFHYHPGMDVGPAGTVKLDVAADQVAWMNEVFADAAADPNIEYLVVQGHVPVIKPVRFQSSSNLGLESGSASAFWQAMAAAKVDLYLAGEVHAMTTSGANGVEQVCHGGLMGSTRAPTVSYLVGSVYPDRIELELKWIDLACSTSNTAKLWQAGSNRPCAEFSLDEANGFTTAGTMVIDHSGPTPVVRDRTGFFLRFREQPAPGLLVHLPLDDAQGGRTPNLGFSTALHHGRLSGGTFGAGKLGNGLMFTAGDVVTVGGTPLSSAWPRTVSAWVKPTPGDALATVLTFGKNETGGKWDFDIDHPSGGVVELGIGGGRTNAAGTTSVTDGEWHHIAVVLPQGATQLDQAVVYVDGVAINSTAGTTAINTVAEVPDQNSNSPSLFYLGRSANTNSAQAYEGGIDDVAIWSRALDATEMRALVSVANTAELAYNASQVDALLTAFAAQRDVTIGARTWTYQASGLTGAEGVVETMGAGFALNLGGGAGFVSP